MEFTPMSAREYRALGAEDYEQRRSTVLDLATEVPEDATDEQLRAIDAEVTIISAEDARRSELAATRNATRTFVENGGGTTVENVEITQNGEEMLSGEYTVNYDTSEIDGVFHASDKDTTIHLPFEVKDGTLHIYNNNGEEMIHQ